MVGLFVTGTGTDVGKTYVTAALVRAMRDYGVDVDVLKPVVSGFDPGRPAGSDPAVLLEALGTPLSDQTLDWISPWRFSEPLSPPLAAKLEGRILVASDVAELCRLRLAASVEGVLLIEGAGGVMSPLDDDHTMLDLAVAVDLPVLVVAGSYLGSISHTLTAVQVLRSRTTQPLAVVVSHSVEGPPIGPTLEALHRLIADVPVFEVLRGGPAPSRLLRWVDETTAE